MCEMLTRYNITTKQTHRHVVKSDEDEPETAARRTAVEDWTAVNCDNATPASC